MILKQESGEFGNKDNTAAEGVRRCTAAKNMRRA